MKATENVDGGSGRDMIEDLSKSNNAAHYSTVNLENVV